MVSVVRGVLVAEDAMALRDTPPGWLCVECLGWWWIGRRDELSGEECYPLGPFPTAREAVDAADAEERRTRAEPERS